MSNIEEHIRQAMQEGKFDNLSKKGKKLDLDDNPLADPEWRLAHHMLQSSGFTLPWIETRQQIEIEVTAARAAGRLAWEWRTEALSGNQFSAAFVAVEWDRAESNFRDAIEKINRKIRTYNLEAPSEKVHLMILNADWELSRLQEPDVDSAG